MTLQDLSLSYNERQRLIATQRGELATRAWSTVDAGNIADSWLRALPDAVRMVQAGKVAAATGAGDYVSAALLEQDVQPAPAGEIDPAAFAQSAADGRPLGSLLYTPVIEAQSLVAAGVPAEQALSRAGNRLGVMVRTEVADAGRQAVNVGIVSDRRAQGYYREVGRGACARCAILAGKWFSTAAGAAFERHPKCQCTAVAAAKEGSRNPTGFSPEKYFASLSRADQDKLFGAGAAAAIRDGADISQVVNASRGMSKIGDWATTEGTSRSGYFAYVQRAIDRERGIDTAYTARNVGPRGAVKNYTQRRLAQQRLTPESIYRIASDDRELAIQMLTQNGYVLPARGQTIRDVARSTLRPVTIARNGFAA